MNFHVYIEDALQHDLAAFCKATGKKRNAVVREALREHLHENDPVPDSQWKEFIRNFPAYPDFPSMEELRAGLLPPREDIF